MRIELPKEMERFGAVRFGSLQRIFELDSGLKGDRFLEHGTDICNISYEALSKLQEEMAIVVPVKGERLKLIEGVLCGIPHQCLTIVVSNSPRQPIDRFMMEQEAFESFCVMVDKNALIVHQKDQFLCDAFKSTGYKHILDKNGVIQDGKAEGMLVGMVLAWLAGKRYIGFIDSDNYFPGAAEEYARAYAAGFIISKSPYSMVRISWQSKPKIVHSKLFFHKWGRASRRTNIYLNKLIAHYTGYETDNIKTGNAGEHAMTMDLALNLDYAGGYAVEPYHIVNLLEKFGGIIKSPLPEVMKKGVEVYQIETRNPHLHESREEGHIEAMSRVALEAIYYSAICPPELKKEIRYKMGQKGLVGEEEELTKPRKYPPLSGIGKEAFLKALEQAPYTPILKGGKLRLAVGEKNL